MHKGEINDNNHQNNEKIREAYAYISKEIQKDYNSNKLIVVGTIKVDEHSRLTLSKKIKTVFPIYSGDTIAVYQDLINNNLLLKVQRHNEVLDTWIIKRQNNDTISSSYSSNTNTIQIHDKNIITNNDHNEANKEDLTKSDFNIMIVDDDADIVEFYKDLLLYSINNYKDNNKKYNIETFNTSSDALKRFIDINTNIKPSFYYSLIIIDIKMPFISGLQLYQLFKTINPDTKILFISALDAAEDLVCTLPGIKSKDILKKPLDSQDFISKVNEKLK
jgi:CheY-like chemotaxis protein